MSDQPPPGRPADGSAPGEVTRLLLAWNSGDEEAQRKLVPLVYGELHRLAQRYMAGERKGHTLQPTALVHEAYLRLVDKKSASWKNRAHFLAMAARSMRQILVDHARRRDAGKRGGGRRVSLGEVEVSSEPRKIDLLALDEALVRLEGLDSSESRLVELRFFGGLTIEETAEAMGVSTITVSRGWRHARAWLHREIVGTTP